jgi:hypothetical protein
VVELRKGLPRFRRRSVIATVFHVLRNITDLDAQASQDVLPGEEKDHERTLQRYQESRVPEVGGA